ncbi:hypothetical protein B0A50_03433 [Salinomyces thailandicus]|uniref:Uncharacterized protein n=1 Tax=Salinomyces thailandicus TaxID=706561 RepID=A0A4U0U229_9PEZI|nr:hypothetical protein B0A50_03433 [Salinomyces thailandica]
MASSESQDAQLARVEHEGNTRLSSNQRRLRKAAREGRPVTRNGHEGRRTKRSDPSDEAFSGATENDDGATAGDVDGINAVTSREDEQEGHENSSSRHVDERAAKRLKIRRRLRNPSAVRGGRVVGRAVEQRSDGAETPMGSIPAAELQRVVRRPGGALPRGWRAVGWARQGAVLSAKGLQYLVPGSQALTKCARGLRWGGKLLQQLLRWLRPHLAKIGTFAGRSLISVGEIIVDYLREEHPNYVYQAHDAAEQEVQSLQAAEVERVVNLAKQRFIKSPFLFKLACSCLACHNERIGLTSEITQPQRHLSKEPYLQAKHASEAPPPVAEPSVEKSLGTYNITQNNCPPRPSYPTVATLRPSTVTYGGTQAYNKPTRYSHINYRRRAFLHPLTPPLGRRDADRQAKSVALYTRGHSDVATSYHTPAPITTQPAAQYQPHALYASIHDPDAWGLLPGGSSEPFSSPRPTRPPQHDIYLGMWRIEFEFASRESRAIAKFVAEAAYQDTTPMGLDVPGFLREFERRVRVEKQLGDECHGVIFPRVNIVRIQDDSQSAFIDAIPAQTSQGSEMNLTSSHGSAMELTNPHGSPMDLTSSHGSPMDLTTTHGSPMDLTTTHGSPMDLTTTHGSPMDLTTTHGSAMDLTSPQASAMKLRSPRGSAKDLTSPQGSKMDLTTPQGAATDPTSPQGSKKSPTSPQGPPPSPSADDLQCPQQ